MNVRQIWGKLLASPASGLVLTTVNSLLYSDHGRKLLVRVVDRWLRANLDSAEHVRPAWARIARDQRLIALAIVHTVDRLVERRIISPRVAQTVVKLWSRALCLPLADRRAARRFKEEHGCGPPWFITISPGHACNLNCIGCYAGSGSNSAKLPWLTLDRIITEAKELWGIPLVVISGGEPLLYRAGEKDLLDAVEKHSDCLFLMYTNGTLIDRETAARLARLGNLTPALSVEGMRQSTDECRGAGVFDRVLEAAANLREAGVPFGISVTVTRFNCEEVLSDEFLNFFFREQGAFYCFFFHYMPIGRSPALGRMPTPEQRIEFWRRCWEVVASKHIFLFDFWNSGPLVQGCISAGREGGYIYIDWNGNVMPCVFAPYSIGNIQELHAQGGTLNDLWNASFFQAIRQWQRDYGYGRSEPLKEGNWLCPCPIRDHHREFREWIDCYQPTPQDEPAEDALADEGYYEGLVAYGTELGELSQEIWESQYLRQR